MKSIYIKKREWSKSIKPLYACVYVRDCMYVCVCLCSCMHMSSVYVCRKSYESVCVDVCVDV